MNHDGHAGGHARGPGGNLDLLGFVRPRRSYFVGILGEVGVVTQLVVVALLPGAQFIAVGVDGAAFVMPVAVDRAVPSCFSQRRTVRTLRLK